MKENKKKRTKDKEKDVNFHCRVITDKSVETDI